MNTNFGLLAIVFWGILTLSSSPIQELQPPATTIQTQKSGPEQVNNAQPGEYPLDTLALKSVLPLPKEVSGYVRGFAEAGRVEPEQEDHKHYAERGIQYVASFSGYRREGTCFEVRIRIHTTPDAARKATLSIVDQGFQGGKWNENSFFGRRIGERVWHSGDGGLMMILDGRVNLSVSINESVLRDEAGNLIRDAQGTPVLYQITEADMRLEERLAIDTLERLRVLGVTSKPASKATARARRQVKERRDDLMKGF